ncbi:NTE family protein [Geodermatophilus obscurus]|uniref:NTE family protein n=1 Tax=Geodermatophilus obscurus TaxID=1861 RepID=A0A1M7T0E1_9ACTN|nr:hypothetical protein [Geodermatophilus obscurus]SHN64196.1 NTE family protein [Geodermatophilus obscurus]
MEAVLASAAVTPLFGAVHVGDSCYWDGLFSWNPPVHQLPDTGPEGVWVIRINPLSRAREPKTIADIADRRNELAGNLSLQRELCFIAKVSEWAERLGDRYRHIEVRATDLDLDLDVASLLDRSPAFISRLLEEGRREATRFLATVPS